MYTNPKIKIKKKNFANLKVETQSGASKVRYIASLPGTSYHLSKSMHLMWIIYTALTIFVVSQKHY